MLPQCALDVVEELLDRVQPRGVLGVEEDVCFEAARRLVDRLVLVDGSVVHEDHYVLVLSILVDPQLLEDAMQEVVEDYGVGSPFSYLGGNDAVLGHGGYHREGVAGQLLRTLLALEPS